MSCITAHFAYLPDDVVHPIVGDHAEKASLSRESMLCCL
jgi:hypothetical protein